MSVAARSSTLAEIGLSGGITIANIAGVSEANADMRTLAGYLALSIPFICIAIVNGVGTFVHLAGQLTGATTQAGSAAAAEVAGGNFSFGNVSVGNQQMGNISQSQRNFSSSLSGADHMLMNGVEQIRYGNDGSHIFNSQYSSGKIDGSFDTSDAISQSVAIQNINSALRSNETALTESDSIREGRGWDALQQISKSNQNIEQHSDTMTSSHSESAHNLLHVLGGHGDRADYSHGNSTTLGTSLGFGGGKGSGFPLGVSGGTQAQASNAENLRVFI